MVVSENLRWFLLVLFKILEVFPDNDVMVLGHILYGKSGWSLPSCFKVHFHAI